MPSAYKYNRTLYIKVAILYPKSDFWGFIITYSWTGSCPQKASLGALRLAPLIYIMTVATGSPVYAFNPAKLSDRIISAVFSAIIALNTAFRLKSFSYKLKKPGITT
jgi:hypothetical protein